VRYSTLALVAMLVALAGCAPSQPATRTGAGPGVAPQQQPAVPTARATKRIVTAIRGDPHTIADAINSAGGGRVAGVREVEQLLNSGLGLVDNQGALRPLLAEVVPSVDNGQWEVFPDGRMQTTWKLRTDVFWHDGTRFSTDDLLFTSRVAKDRELTLAQDVAYKYVESIEAPDERTLVVTWTQPFIEADTLFSRTERSRILPMPSHLLERAYTDEKATFTEQPFWTDGFIGTGPYRLDSWTFGSHMVLKSNDRFVLGKPKIDEIEVKFLWDTNVIVSNVLSGAVELTLGAGLTVEQAMNAREQWREGRVETPLVNVTGLWPQFLNPDPAVMADVTFRRALLHALDRQAIVDSFLGGLVPVAHSFISPSDAPYREVEPSVVKYEHDARKATQMIESLGYTRGADGAFAEAGGGRKLVVEMRTTAHELREKLMFVIGDQWQRVGVGMDAVIIPRQRASDRAYRNTSLSFDFRFNPPDPTRYHSSQMPLAENNYRGTNSAHYRNAAFDAMIDRYVVTIPKQERTRILAQMIQHMTDQIVVVPLFHDAEPVFIGNRLLNVSGRAADSLQGWNVQEWDVKS
jgi:peptide/nickel transport system substrate-binding protein